MRFVVDSTETAAAALSYFNFFHDSFVARIQVDCAPVSPYAFEYAIPVRWRAEVVLAHTNYPGAEGRPIATHRVTIDLHEIAAFQIGDLVQLDTMLQEVSIRVADGGGVHVDIGGDGSVVFRCGRVDVDDGTAAVGP